MTYCAQCGQPTGTCEHSNSPYATATKAEPIPVLPTIALVLTFFSPLIGLILALIGKNEAAALGGLAAKRNKLALIWSIVLLSLGVLLWIVYGVAIIALLSHPASYGSDY